MSESSPTIEQPQRSSRLAIVVGAIVLLTALPAVAWMVWPQRDGPDATPALQAQFGGSGTSQQIETLRRDLEALREENRQLRTDLEQLRREQEELRRQSPGAAPGGPPAYQQTQGAPVAGPLERLIDTGTVVVAGQTLKIYGIRPINDPQHVNLLAAFVRENGNQLTCEPRNGLYTCRTASGHDLAAVVLANGGARAAREAPPEYRQYEAEAKKKRLGVWRG